MTQQVCLGHVGATVARQPTETANRTKNKREREKKTAQKKSYLLGYHITYCHVHACHMCDMLDFGNFSVDRRPICLHCSGFYVILPGKSRLRDDILCVEWDVKLYTHSLPHAMHVTNEHEETSCLQDHGCDEKLFGLVPLEFYRLANF